MKRTPAVLLLLAFAMSSFAEDSRIARRDAIRELLKTLDAKTLTQSMFDLFFAVGEACGADWSLRERLFARLDYVSYSEEVYGPVFDGTFSDSELRQLITFFKTPAGQKVVRLFPELAFNMLRNGDKIASIAREIEEERSEPWEKTMEDLRTVATAAEAYATDENRYPIAGAYEDLGAILSPTYIKTLPEADAWGTPFVYVSSPDGQHYRFVSAGADKRFETGSDRVETLPEDFAGRSSDNLEADIIFQDGIFVQFPVMQKNPR